MDEIIVRLTRSLACHDRLRLISCLVAEGELSPTELARKLKVSATALSGHMTKLTAMGLIKRRRSGAWSYCVAESPYGESTLSGMTLAWLRQVLASPEQALKDCGLHEVRNSRLRAADGLRTNRRAGADFATRSPRPAPPEKLQTLRAQLVIDCRPPSVRMLRNDQNPDHAQTHRRLRPARSPRPPVDQ